MAHIRTVVAAALAALTVVLMVLAPGTSITAFAAGVAVVFLAAVLAAHAATLTSDSGGSRARTTAFVRRQKHTAEPAPQHPDTAGRPRTRAPSRGSRA
jgi:hypothetical protein